MANEYGFDLDETVTLKLEIHHPAGNRLFVAYDKSDGLGHEPVTLPNAPEQAAHVVTLTLPRAQLADRGDYGTDLMIAAQASASYIGPPPPPITICDVRLERSYTTPAPDGARLARSDRGGGGRQSRCRLASGSTIRPGGCRSLPTKRSRSRSSTIGRAPTCCAR